MHLFEGALIPKASASASIRFFTGDEHSMALHRAARRLTGSRNR
jgi:hypothetical protein